MGKNTKHKIIFLGDVQALHITIVLQNKVLLNYRVIEEKVKLFLFSC